MKTRVTTLLVLLIAAIGLTACGDDHEPTVGETEGVYVNAGGLKYQVQISRQLNASNPEDREYLYGVPGGDRPLPRGVEWFAVFIRVANQHKDGPALLSASQFWISDTADTIFRPIKLLPEANAHAYAPQRIAPEKHYPILDVTAGSSTTQGTMLLFRVTHAALDNRPLEFHIRAPDGSRAYVDLDI